MREVWQRGKPEPGSSLGAWDWGMWEAQWTCWIQGGKVIIAQKNDDEEWEVFFGLTNSQQMIQQRDKAILTEIGLFIFHADVHHTRQFIPTGGINKLLVRGGSASSWAGIIGGVRIDEYDHPYTLGRGEGEAT